MAYKDYDGLDTDKAIAKLLSKGIFDAEDKAFALARSEYLTAEQLAAITGDEIPESVDAGAGEPEGNDANQTPPSDENDGLVKKEDHSLPELQALAAESNLDTSGTKQDLCDRINAFRKEEAEKAEAGSSDVTPEGDAAPTE
jgi:hypothetical protein